MVISNITNSSTEVITNLVTKIGEIGLWMQTIGIIVIVTLVGIIINYFSNKKRLREIETIQTKLDKIENKLNKILKEK